MTITGEGGEPPPLLTLPRLFAVGPWRVSGNRGPAVLPASPTHLGAASWGQGQGSAGQVIIVVGLVPGAVQGPGRCLLNGRVSGPWRLSSLVTRPGFRNKQNELSLVAQCPLCGCSCGQWSRFCLMLALPPCPAHKG